MKKAAAAPAAAAPAPIPPQQPAPGYRAFSFSYTCTAARFCGTAALSIEATPSWCASDHVCLRSVLCLRNSDRCTAALRGNLVAADTAGESSSLVGSALRSESSSCAGPIVRVVESKPVDGDHFGGVCEDHICDQATQRSEYWQGLASSSPVVCSRGGRRP